MSTAETWTINRLLAWTADYFKKQQLEQPRLEAEVLLSHALGCPRIALYTRFEEVVGDDSRAKFRELVKNRVAGMPVAYIVGKKEFYSLNFTVTRDTLIPRPETEHLVTAVLDALKTWPAGEALQVADVGTGSGAIAIAVAKYAPQAQVTAIDASASAVVVAQRNVQDLRVADRVRVTGGDLLTNISGDTKFHAIAANLPYVSQAEYEALDKSVKDFEPATALIAGPTGTETIARLLPQAAAHLHAGGLLALEVSPMIADQVASLVNSQGSFSPALITKDLAGHKRIVSAKRL